MSLKPRRPLRRGPGLRALLLVADLTATGLGWVIALVAPVGIERGLGRPARDAAYWAAGAVVVHLLLLAAHRLYLARTCAVRAVEVQLLARASLLAGLIVGWGPALLFEPLGPKRVTFGAVLAFAFLGVGRASFRSWLKGRRNAGHHQRSVVLVGGNEDAARLHAHVREHPELGLRVTGVVAPVQARDAIDAPWLGELEDSARAVTASEATGALVVATAIPVGALNGLVRELLDVGVHVHLASGLRGISHRRLRVVPLAREPLFYLERSSLTGWQVRAKRALDVTLAALGLLAALPVLLLAMLAIRLDSPGPLLFRQRRIGRNGRSFLLYKLRTMVVDAEDQVEELRARNQRGGPLFKLAGDPRVTRVGRLLRATSIDELPQLVNVLAGSMSLVGPRPALPSEAERFDDDHQARFLVLPGISGLWQVEARDNPAFEPYRRLDLFYVENWSVGLDLSILAATVFAVLSRGLRLSARALRRRPDDRRGLE